MSNMFANCNSIEKLNLSNLSNISTTECYQMFFQCTKLKELDISGFTNFSIKNTSEILTGYLINSIVFVKNQRYEKMVREILKMLILKFKSKMLYKIMKGYTI